MSKSDKLPAIQFYPGDWRKDAGVQALGYYERGVWFEMLMLMHESSHRGKLLLNEMAMPQEALAQVLGLDNQILTTTLTKLEAYGVCSRCEETGAIMCRRMVKDEEVRRIRKKCGSLGGNPALVNQKPTTGVKLNGTTGVKQTATPSSSTSVSVSTSSNTPKPPRGLRSSDKGESGKDPRHQEFIAIWDELYFERVGEKCVYGSREFAHLSEFLEKCKDVTGEKFRALIIAAKAHAASNPYCTHAKKTTSLGELAKNYSAIREELVAARGQTRAPAMNGHYAPTMEKDFTPEGKPMRTGSRLNALMAEMEAAEAEQMEVQDAA